MQAMHAARRLGKRKVTSGHAPLVRMINNQIARKVEKKYIDLFSGGPLSVTTTASFALLNGITQGTTSTNRVGNEIRVIGIDMRYQWICGDATQICRFIIVQDKQCNTAIFNPGDLLNTGTDPLSPLNEDFLKRFHILYDKSVGNMSGTLGPNCHLVVKRIRPKLNCYYTGSGNTISNIKTNSIYVFTISDSTGVPNPTISYAIRLWYKDA